MKNNKFFQDQNQKAARLTTAEKPNQTEIDFIPSADEVARKAYFSYLNEGSAPGRDVQHWLEAEAQLLIERRLTRIHGFHNRT